MPIDLSTLKLGTPAPDTAAEPAQPAERPPGLGSLTLKRATPGGGVVAGAPDRATTLEDLVAADTAEMTAIATAFGKSAEAEASAFIQTVDTEFWVALAFQTRDAKERFLALTGWIELGDKYLCGEDVAARMGISLPVELIPIRKRPVHARLRALVSQLGVDTASAAEPAADEA